MKDKKEIKDILSRIDIIEQKIEILEEKLEETKNFSFEQIKNVLLRLMNLEERISKIK